MIMIRFTSTLLLAAIVVGGIWALMNRDRIQHPSDIVQLVQESLKEYPSTIEADFPAPSAQVPIEPVVRIATLKLDRFGASLGDYQNLSLVAKLCRPYDAIAIQGMAGDDNNWVEQLALAINSTGQDGDYTFVTDLSKSDPRPTQNAIFYNQRTLAMDHHRWYTVADPDDLLSRNPLVAWFRTRVPDPDRAFTFTLVNVEMASQRIAPELPYLGDLFRAVRNDGRGEDDVIIAGDFNCGDRGLDPLRKHSDLTWVVSNAPTDVRSSMQTDNLLFSSTSTTEFTGQGGVFDFMRQYNLRIKDAEQISRRMPVWAEFSVYEGEIPGSGVVRQAAR